MLLFLNRQFNVFIFNIVFQIINFTYYNSFGSLGWLDHCADDIKGKLNPKAKTSFRWIPNGIPGVETRLPIFFSEGVSKKRISIKQFVEQTSTNHAKIYGLWPHKGSIDIGFDADIVLWDQNKKTKIHQKNLHHGSDYTPWENFEVTGVPITTITNGRVVFQDQKFISTKPLGKFISRGYSSLIEN
jgi:dihydropyrimidinase